ncbi:MAG: hypothetical protein OHK0046_12690 [Anaerolineae bacterium]
MIEHPVYVQLLTEESQPHFDNKSAAEAVIDTLIHAQNEGWLVLHGFVVLPDALEMACSPLRQGVSGVVAHVQSYLVPVLSVLLPKAVMVWSSRYVQKPLLNQRALNARLKMLRLAPVAYGLSDVAEEYPFSSANLRYRDYVDMYAGFADELPMNRADFEGGVKPLIRNITTIEDILTGRSSTL